MVLGSNRGLGDLNNPGHPGHILSRSSRSDLLYKISRSDLDSALDHVFLMAFGSDQSDELSMLDGDNGSIQVSP